MDLFTRRGFVKSAAISSSLIITPRKLRAAITVGNRFAIPSGVAPGVPGRLLGSVLMSAVATNNAQMVGISPYQAGVVGTVTGTNPTQTTHGLTGPMINLNTTSVLQWLNFPVSGPIALTMAAIFNCTSYASNHNILGASLANNTATVMRSGLNAQVLYCSSNQGCSSGTGVFVNNNPVVIMWSLSFTTSAGRGGNFLAVDLVTGKQAIAPQFTAATSSSFASGGGGFITGQGSATTPTGPNGSIAAFLCLNRSMSLGEMVQWSTDPWSMWYPNPDVRVP